MDKSIKLVIHNQVTINNSITYRNYLEKFDEQQFDLQKFDAILSGSNTLQLTLQQIEIPKIIASDKECKDPLNKNELPQLVVIDSTGKFMNKLHVFRRMKEYQDIIVFISDFSEKIQKEQLFKHHFHHHICGHSKVNLTMAIQLLKEKQSISTIRSDCGPTLNNILLNANLVSEIHNLIIPKISSNNNLQFSIPDDKVYDLVLHSQETVFGKYTFVVYHVKYNSK